MVWIENENEGEGEQEKIQKTTEAQARDDNHSYKAKVVNQKRKIVLSSRYL